MFCPRCGSPNPDTTKFCRQCGLGLQAVTGYVAGGGTAQLPQSQPTSSNPIANVTEGLTPKQKMILAILVMVMSPAIFGTLGMGSLSGVSAVLMPIGIVFVVMWFKAQQRRLQEAASRQQMYPPAQPYQMPPPTAYGLPQAGQPTVSQTHQPPVYQHPPSPPPTNPLGPGSIIEDETRRLPEGR
ncbi:MAG TPA: zinc ribbon domain-containing protein [Blastocatellia bacterium]|nr:zinc ribbon domain-containing protein [Blastocatellia bacterium]HMX28911.1 zinc ribbon domain-containing protein [Blastocatellia bacterium]HMY70854.1 zinc ribbon domain-containing protein [Blastocatellia bacterium]HMZ17437.1 zinc ribbon domain-containing protein [Blastocatellia bacterium]HNG28779.1 zinc ribbon domain-containing protein [Blastocatellia bacterium]